MVKFNKQKRIDGKNIPVKKRAISEFQSYTYIKNELKEMGWNTKNPNTEVKGQLYTQKECLGNPEIKSVLGNLVPEYVVKLREDAFWVIEAKATPVQIDIAYDEAIDYGKIINEHQFIKAKIVSGVAGNDSDRYLIRSGFWDEDKKEYFVIEYEGKEITSLISPELTEILLKQQSHIIKDLVYDEKYFVKIAEEINKILHLSSIKKDKRPGIVATILLSMLGKTEPNYNAETTIFIDDINKRADNILMGVGKGGFFKHIKIQLPEEKDAQDEFKEALVTVFFLLKKANIKSAMKSGSDVLGKFYEVFLKYGNGAKDLGILLTPRNVTKYASEVLDISHKDVIYDPTCGTGGFLVSAFYHVKGNSTRKQLDDFKQHKIFGIDRQSTVTTLAVINMLFRGDGKNNIINTNCLGRSVIPEISNGQYSAKFVSKSEGDKVDKRPITKVLMNPPFSLKKKGEREYDFVNHALKQMDDGGLLFSIFPCSGMVKQMGFLKWRKDMLKENTLLSVITLPEDVFYPQGTPPTLCFIIKKGISHPENQDVLWIRAMNDGYSKVKSKRLPDPKVPNDLESSIPTIQAFINNPSSRIENIPEIQKTTPIDFSDNNLELIPEAYLEAKEPTLEDIEEGIDKTIRRLISFLIISKKGNDFKQEVVDEWFYKKKYKKECNKYSEYPIIELFTVQTGHFHKSSALDNGKVPLISCSSADDGTETYVNISPELLQHNSLTIACDGQPLTSFYHYYPFVAKDNVMICYPKQQFRFTTLLFIVMQLNRLTWRFSYGRKCYLNKIDKIKIFLPINEQNKIDEDYIEYLTKKSSAWDLLLKLFPEEG